MENQHINKPHNSFNVVNKSGSFWHEMKPFVKFGFKALGIMAGALIAIVKAIPSPTKNDKNKKPTLTSDNSAPKMV